MPSHAHIPGCARLNVMRLNAARLNYYEPIPIAVIGGIDRSRQIRIEGAAVTHVLNDAPDTASVRVHGFTPVAGQDFAIYLGDRTPAAQLMGGRILETTALYESLKQNVAHDLQIIDPTWLLNRRRVLAQYVGIGATDIVRDILSRFAPGTGWTITSANTWIDKITFTNETLAACLTAVCERIGAYWYQDYAGIVHVFTDEGTVANPITDATPRGARDLLLSEDLSQVVTRVIARGGGGRVAVGVPATSSELPVDDPAWYSDGGGLVEIAGALRVSYSTVRGRSGAGALVGTGNAPSGAPSPQPASGSSHTVGATYGYAATFTTASGETLPGPVGSITIKTLAMIAPPALSARSRGAGSYPPGMITPGASVFRFAVQIVYLGGAWGPLGAASAVYTWDGNDWELYLGPRAAYLDGFYYPTLEPGGPVATVSHVQILRSDNGGPWMYISSDYWGSGGGWFSHCASGWGTGGGVQPSTGFGSVVVKTIPVSSASTVTGRKLYRTTANGAQLKLLTTLANNTTTEYGDTIADAALGANAPTADTAQLTDNRQHPAGSTSLPVSDTTPFQIDGGTSGWIRVAGMPVVFTGVAPGLLTGIPATGIGSLTATVRYGAQVIVQPRLVGIPTSGPLSLSVAVQTGDAIAIRVEVDDAAAQAALAARIGGDGIVEEPYSDSGMTFMELYEYARALLAERKDPRRTLRFQTRDSTVDVGRLITVNLATPPISGTFRIQRVTFSEIAITGGLARVQPLRTVEASNKLYTFADLLRRLRGREGGAQ